MLDASICYLFLIMREQFDVKEMVSFKLLLRTNDWFLDFSSKITKFPPEGYILDGIMYGMLFFSMTMVFLRVYFWLLFLKLMSSRLPMKEPEKSLVSKVRPKQIFTSVYTSE